MGTTCVPPARISEQACGTGGEPCSVCAPGDYCKGGCIHKQSSCDASNCAGCCEAIYCALGVNRVLCGTKGQLCQQCGDNEQCIPTGVGGGLCGGAQRCQPGDCLGCCDGDVCRPGMSNEQCGSNGDPCGACKAGEECSVVYPQGGTCEAPPFCNQCFGCCRGNQCLPGDSDRACGGDGSACQDCTAFGALCDRPSPSGTGKHCGPPQSCSPASCAGCCFGAVCAIGTQPIACGTGGAPCATCARCDSGVCH
jgi:hypothetical protein